MGKVNRRKNGGGALAGKGDALYKSLIASREDARRLDLFELDRLLEEVTTVIVGDFPKRHEAYYEIVTGSKFKDGGGSNKGGTRGRGRAKLLRQGFERYSANLRVAIGAYADEREALELSELPGFAETVVRTLGPKGQFDYAHEIQSVQETVLSPWGISEKKEAERVQSEFEATNPLDTELRAKEMSYNTIAPHAKKVTDAEEANEMGRMAWKTDEKWTAELFWRRATELDGTKAKYWSNLAYARICLARRIRSDLIGYRGLAEAMLNDAAEDAQRSIEADPTWERGYQRAAEAFLALGPYDRAIDACRVLDRSSQHVESPREPLLHLRERAKANSGGWCSLGLNRNGVTIPEIIEASIRHLRSTVVRSLAVDRGQPAEKISKAGDDIVVAALTVKGALEMIYTRRVRWERESKVSRTLTNDVQMDLRTMGRILPLKLVVASKTLKDYIFWEGRFTPWGLDRLDRLGVDFLPFDAPDPCEDDCYNDLDGKFTELLKRRCGETMSLSCVKRVKEIVSGKDETSYDRDMSPNHMSAFSVTILQRIIMSESCPLREEAITRVIDISLTENRNGMWAGGEFFGMAINVASGIGRYLKPDPRQSSIMLSIRGGVATMALEIAFSGDHGGKVQKILARVTPNQWSSQSTYDIHLLLTIYLLPAMDHDFCSLKPEDASPYVTKILPNLLDGHPQVINSFRTGLTLPQRGFLSLFKSSFGVYLMRKFYVKETELIEKKAPSSTGAVVKMIINGWMNSGNRKKSSYRWETLPRVLQLEWAKLKPVSRVDLFTNKSNKYDEDDDRETIKELRKCANCFQLEGFGCVLRNCPCNLVAYCCEKCQKSHWLEHKGICKKVFGPKKKY